MFTEVVELNLFLRLRNRRIALICTEVQVADLLGTILKVNVVFIYFLTSHSARHFGIVLMLFEDALEMAELRDQTTRDVLCELCHVLSHFGAVVPDLVKPLRHDFEFFLLRKLILDIIGFVSRH